MNSVGLGSPTSKSINTNAEQWQNLPQKTLAWMRANDILDFTLFALEAWNGSFMGVADGGETSGSSAVRRSNGVGMRWQSRTGCPGLRC
jgi:hypothetical protein